jgi:Skp family chaperone for outer membrane proteins
MTKSFKLTLVSLLALGAATGALAQTTPAAAPAAPQLNPGPAIAGVCIYSVEEAITQSQMGVAANDRMKQLQAVVEAELKPERDRIETEGQALQTAQKTEARETFVPKAQAFQTKVNAFEEKYNLRLKEMQATQQKVQGLIAQELESPLQVAYQEKGCGLLVDRNAVLFANPSMDITAAVVTKLNAGKKTLSFDREILAAPKAATAAAPRAAAPKPAATAPKPAAAAPKPAAAAAPKPAAAKPAGQ